MNRLVGIVFLLSFAFISFDVSALRVCEKEEKQRLKELAEKVEFTYNYELQNVNEDGRNVTVANFYITASNLSPDLKVTIMEDYYMDLYQEFKDGDNSQATLRGFTTGERVPITIYGFVPNACSGEEILHKTIRLPYYNSYVEDERCKKYPDFEYCSDLINSSIKESVFEAELKRYISSLDEESDQVVVKEKSNLLIIVIIVLSIIIVLSLTLLLILRRRKKYSL